MRVVVADVVERDLVVFVVEEGDEDVVVGFYESVYYLDYLWSYVLVFSVH